MQFSKIGTVFEFEFRRTLTWWRSLMALALAMFPVCMVAIVQLQGAHLERDDRAEIALFLLIPGVTCVMGLLLWATAAINTELEERTWAYLAMRPVGRGTILVGKYLSAVAWTILCAMTSLVLCFAILLACGDAPTSAPALAALVVVSTAAYGAVFTLIGVLFPTRAMVAAVAYTALMEGVVPWLPAAIARFSVFYHLRCLFAQWLLENPSGNGPEFDAIFFGTMPGWQHLALLFGLIAALLTIATVVLSRRQLILSVDG
jgi:ABC-type transport system involved in multi-copper enzyme maturation permease subunit